MILISRYGPLVDKKKKKKQFLESLNDLIHTYENI